MARIGIVLLLILSSPITAAAEDLKACITVFEPRPCVGPKKFLPYRKGILIPAKYGNWDTVTSERGEVLEDRAGIVRGIKGYFFFKGRKLPKAVVAESEDRSCVFLRGADK